MQPESHGRGGLTPEQVREHEDALARHYGEPVRPVSNVCESIRQWLIAVSENHDGDDGMNGQEWRTAKAWREYGMSVFAHASKSNMLYRLLYLGERPRTTKCPEHQGRWSGYAWPGEECPHGCQSGLDTTGWVR